MKIISSQHYLSPEIVGEKVEAMTSDGVTEITLTCWDAGEIEGEEMAVLSDGHHALAAAREMGIEIQYEITRHPEYLTGLELLDVAYMDGDWYDVKHSDPSNEQYDLVW